MGLFGNKDDQQYEVPQYVQPDYSQQYMDPLAAAQLSNSYDRMGISDSVGVANITVDNHKIIEEFKSRLQGYTLKRRFNLETGQEMEPEKIIFTAPVMNDEGVNHLCGLMEVALAKNIMLSNIPEKDHLHIKQIAKIFWRTAALQIAINSERWKVDRTRRDSIPLEMSLTLYTNLMRAYDDGERRKLYPGQKNITTTMINPAQMQPERKPFIHF